MRKFSIIEFANLSFFEIVPTAELSWLSIGEAESNFVLTTSDGDLFESIIFKEADLAPKVCWHVKHIYGR